MDKNADILNKAFQASGLKKKEFAKRLRVSPSHISDILNGRGKASNSLSELAEIHFLVDSVTPTTTSPAFPKPSHGKNKVPSDEMSERYVFVPLYDVEASAGAGAIIHSEQIIDHLAFLRDWIVKDLGLNAEKILLIKAIGDSMEPAIKDGAMLLVDTQSNRAGSDAVYVLRLDGDLVVKRIQNLMDGRVEIISNNSAYKTLISQTNAIDILGKVVWGGQKI